MKQFKCKPAHDKNANNVYFEIDSDNDFVIEQEPKRDGDPFCVYIEKQDAINLAKFILKEYENE